MSRIYCVLLLLLPFVLTAGHIEREVSFSTADLEFSEYEGYDVVRLKHCVPTAQLGKPELAIKPLLVLIPPHAAISSIEVVAAQKTRIKGNYKILPTQHPEPFMIHEPFPFVEPHEGTYALTTEYPGVVAEVTHVGTKGGYRIATVTVHPLQYVPGSEQLFLYTSIRFAVTYDEHQVTPETVWRDDYAEQKAAVKRLVINPEHVEAWSPQVRECTRTAMTGTKGPTFDNPEYAIMVADGFESNFESLRDWRNKKGIPTEIFLRDWILGNYAGATDHEKVRNFIIDYHQNHGTMYFLCVGDWGDFPMNRISTADDPYTPTDFWYQDYDDDHYSEVYVGRASISNATEAQTYVNKVLKYEREPPTTGFYEKIFLPGYELWSGYGNPECDTIAKYDPPSWLDAKRYSYITYLPTSEISDTFNIGYGYAEISAHGNWSGWGSPGHHNADADALNNAPPRCGVCTAICCLIAELDYSGGDSYVEHMMNNPNGGTTAFWGNTRSGYGKIENKGRSEWLDIWFYEELNDNNVYMIGQTCAASKDRAVPYVSDSYVYHCMHCLTLFGDPATQLWTTYPDVLVVSHAGQVPIGPSTFDVNVTSGGSPVRDATVCLMCEQDVLYHVGYTNNQGDVSFTIDPQIADDTMWVTVTKHNYEPYEGYALVGSAPKAPFINEVVKSGSDAVLTWSRVTTNTQDDPVTVDYYVVYRNSAPDFCCADSDSIAAVSDPDTTYTDVGALNAADCYYYLVKAVDYSDARSDKSNMGYKCHRYYNENADATDKNWITLPYWNPYNTVSELTADVSPSGDPLTKITYLLDDQMYDSWVWDEDFQQWTGTDFVIWPDRAYEMITQTDTMLVYVGCHDPEGLVVLNENAAPAATDKNWIPVFDNCVYSTVSDITDEYSPAGDPLVKLTNLRDDQMYESYLWDEDFGQWFGANFVIECGRGYEFIAVNDTTWNPTECTNEPPATFFVQVRPQPDKVQLGTRSRPDRAPAWVMRNGMYCPVATAEAPHYRDVGESHIVRAHFAIPECDDIAFTVYRPDRPHDVLTEQMVGSGTVTQRGRAALWFDAGNFMTPWQEGEQIVLVVEVLTGNTVYFAAPRVTLDRSGIQHVEDEIVLRPVPAATYAHGKTTWSVCDDENVIGYSVYAADTRLNQEIITDNTYATAEDAVVRVVFVGGYENVLSAHGAQDRDDGTAHTSAFSLTPNPFSKLTTISFGIEHSAQSIELRIYDIAGRLVKQWNNSTIQPSNQVVWDGCDDTGRAVAAGVYFVTFECGEEKEIEKAILLR